MCQPHDRILTYIQVLKLSKLESLKMSVYFAEFNEIHERILKLKIEEKLSILEFSENIIFENKSSINGN